MQSICAQLSLWQALQSRLRRCDCEGCWLRRVAALFVVARMKTTVLYSIRAHMQHVALHRARKQALVRLAAKMKPELGAHPPVSPKPSSNGASGQMSKPAALQQWLLSCSRQVALVTARHHAEHHAVVTI